MTDSGYYHTALRSHTVSDFIFDLIESVHDCCILDTKSIEKPFQTFPGILPLKIICDSNESDEESDAGEDLFQPRNGETVFKESGYGNFSVELDSVD